MGWHVTFTGPFFFLLIEPKLWLKLNKWWTFISEKRYILFVCIIVSLLLWLGHTNFVIFFFLPLEMSMRTSKKRCGESKRSEEKENPKREREREPWRRNKMDRSFILDTLHVGLYVSSDYMQRKIHPQTARQGFSLRISVWGTLFIMSDESQRWHYLDLQRNSI